MIGCEKRCEKKFVCINNDSISEELTVGRVYKVFDETPNFYSLVNDNGTSQGYWKHRFAKLEMNRDLNKPVKQVKCIDIGFHEFIKIGCIYNVINESENKYEIFIGKHLKTYNYDKNLFIEINDNKINNKPIKRVRCVNNDKVTCLLTLNKIYDVIDVVDSNIQVCDDTGSRVYFLNFRFEPIEEDKSIKFDEDVFGDVYHVSSSGVYKYIIHSFVEEKTKESNSPVFTKQLIKVQENHNTVSLLVVLMKDCFRNIDDATAEFKRRYNDN